MTTTHAEVEKIIRKIAQDNRSGATTLTQLALNSFERLVDLTKPNESLPIVTNKVKKVGTRLLQAKPIMGSIFNLSNSVIMKSGKATSASKLLESIKETTTTFHSQLAKSNQQISKRASALIEDNCCVTTISYSMTVLEALKKAEQEGKDFEVICPESRPIKEGIELAFELNKNGISVTVVADCLAPTLLKETDLVLVGGDALSYGGLVNKAGTYMLAKISQDTKTKVIALLSTQKFMPIEEISKFIPEEDPSELLEDSKSGVKALNRYFDVTPFDLIDQVITEEGILSPVELDAKLGEMVVDETLIELFK